ncbi:MAG: hypothetical protein A3G81_30065 [Betaproteobacteria bacterium RIFCSPLOWO2_12_FULL_65_14]|nr:MAG: hypothetical protein A3G81_30065 [Betaproteobacteria bacterium RIFCSPLOWO2_12_FULL_65_14]
MGGIIRVLHLEDDPRDAALVRKRLEAERFSCEILVAEGRKDFESALKREAFDLVLLDYQVPGYDGMTALRRARQYQPHVPIVVVSGVLTEEEAVQCVKAGATDYLLKNRLRRLPLALERALQEAAAHRQRAQAEKALQDSQRRLELALDASGLATWDWDVMTGNVHLSPQWFRILGYEPEPDGARIKTWEKRTHADDLEALRSAIAAQFKGADGSLEAEYRMLAKSGEWRWIRTLGRVVERDKGGQVLRMSGTHGDVTARKASEDRIRYLATHDGLTGLPNRNLLADRAAQAIGHARRTALGLGVLVLDLDHFQYVNDGHGYPVGDALLQAMAHELQELVREGDTVARLGGDEFVLLLSDLKNGAVDANAAAQRVLDRLSRPVAAVGHEFTVTASIGISLYPADGQDSEVLFRNAGAAMHSAKASGRNAARFYLSEMNESALERISLEEGLRHALELGQLELHYQPQVAISNGEVIGMEALMRWRHPEKGLISPGKFIPVAEETGLIVPIGEWALATACAQNAAWQAAGLPRLTVSVNLSALQFRHPGLPETVSKVLRETGLAAHNLDLELTESMVMGQMEYVISRLRELNALGVQLSMDDFGTGYSSLGSLKSFSLDRLKMDQSFVRDLPADQNAASIAQAIVSMGRSLGMQVIAEGVETQAQADYLMSIGCKYAQGYLYSRPLPAGECETWQQAAMRRQLSD